jgi:hypothetical protein
MRIARKRLVDDYLIGAEVWITHSLVNLGEDSYVTRAKTYNHPSEFGSKHTVDMDYRVLCIHLLRLEALRQHSF